MTDERKLRHSANRQSEMMRVRDRDIISANMQATIEEAKRRISDAFADGKKVRARLKDREHEYA